MFQHSNERPILASTCVHSAETRSLRESAHNPPSALPFERDDEKCCGGVALRPTGGLSPPSLFCCAYLAVCHEFRFVSGPAGGTEGTGRAGRPPRTTPAAPLVASRLLIAPHSRPRPGCYFPRSPRLLTRQTRSRHRSPCLLRSWYFEDTRGRAHAAPPQRQTDVRWIGPLPLACHCERDAVGRPG